mmetsp:Transcript_126857/g.406191  ORF Transcript_126857/g.406191 Transcript_126857/m.406191 type:complete len:249 (+) Transcript_126857:41-787(+)
MLDVAGAAHCSVPQCHQLDFLPFRCDACCAIFCKEHFAFARHSCPKADAASVQVLVCPLCTEAVRLNPSEDPNTTWERHYAGGCRQVAPAKTAAARCPVEGCKEKLGLSNRFECTRCRTTVCLRHRAQEDHPCRVASATGRFGAGRGASRASASSAGAAPRGHAAPPQAPAQRAGAGGAAAGAQMSEDERMARELQRQEELAAAGMAAPGRPRKRGLRERMLAAFACFRTPQATSRLLGSGGRSSDRQ